MDCESTFKKFLGKKISFDNTQVELEDANVKSQPTSLFKIMWLPRQTSHEKVNEFISSKIKSELILKIENEKMRDRHCEHIDTGLIKFFLLETADNRPNYENICGKQSIFGDDVFIIKVGEGKRCIYCSELNHIKKDCPKLAEDQKKICSRCHNKGHTVKECSISKVISGQKDAEAMLCTEDENLFEENAISSVKNNNKENNINLKHNNNNNNIENKLNSNHNNNNNKESNKNANHDNKNKENDINSNQKNNNKKSKKVTQTNVSTVKVQFKSDQTSTPTVKRNNPCSNTSNEQHENKKQKDDYDEESLESAYNEIASMRNEDTIMKKQ